MIVDLKQKIHVKLINLQGLEEAGVDGGGLFRYIRYFFVSGLAYKVNTYARNETRFLVEWSEVEWKSDNFTSICLLTTKEFFMSLR